MLEPVVVTRMCYKCPLCQTTFNSHNAFFTHAKNEHSSIAANTVIWNRSQAFHMQQSTSTDLPCSRTNKVTTKKSSERASIERSVTAIDVQANIDEPRQQGVSIYVAEEPDGSASKISPPSTETLPASEHDQQNNSNRTIKARTCCWCKCLFPDIEACLEHYGTDHNREVRLPEDINNLLTGGLGGLPLVKDVKCLYCQKMIRPASFLQHINLRHFWPKIPVPVKCSICGRVLKHSTNIQAHIRNVHGGIPERNTINNSDHVNHTSPKKKRRTDHKNGPRCVDAVQSDNHNEHDNNQPEKNIRKCYGKSSGKGNSLKKKQRRTFHKVVTESVGDVLCTGDTSSLLKTQTANEKSIPVLENYDSTHLHVPVALLGKTSEDHTTSMGATKILKLDPDQDNYKSDMEIDPCNIGGVLYENNANSLASNLNYDDAMCISVALNSEASAEKTTSATTVNSLQPDHDHKDKADSKRIVKARTCCWCKEVFPNIVQCLEHYRADHKREVRLPEGVDILLREDPGGRPLVDHITCLYCQKAIRSISYLQHVNLRHFWLKMPVPTKCKICGLVVKSSRNIQSHIVKVHRGVKQPGTTWKDCTHSGFTSRPNTTACRKGEQSIDNSSTVNKTPRKETTNNIRARTCCVCDKLFPDTMTCLKHYAADHQCDVRLPHNYTNLSKPSATSQVSSAEILAGSMNISITQSGSSQGEHYIECLYCNRLIMSTLFLEHVSVKHIWMEKYKQKRQRKKYDTNSSDPGLMCSFCGITVGCSNYLRTHIMTFHGGESAKKRPNAWLHGAGVDLLCEKCPFKCKEKRRMTAHLLKHEGKMMYSCSHCDYKTWERTSIRDHRYRHLKQKKYKCEYCEYQAIQKPTLRGHVKNKHGIDLPKKGEPGYCKKWGIQKQAGNQEPTVSTTISSQLVPESPTSVFVKDTSTLPLTAISPQLTLVSDTHIAGPVIKIQNSEDPSLAEQLAATQQDSLMPMMDNDVTVPCTSIPGVTVWRWDPLY